MAQSTVDLQKMKSVSSELDKIYTTLTNNQKKLNELVTSLMKVWKGEGATAYNAAYQSSTQEFTQLAEAVRSCSASLATIATTYGKADSAAAEAIKSKMAKG